MSTTRLVTLSLVALAHCGGSLVAPGGGPPSAGADAAADAAPEAAAADAGCATPHFINEPCSARGAGACEDPHLAVVCDGARWQPYMVCAAPLHCDDTCDPRSTCIEGP